MATIHHLSRISQLPRDCRLALYGAGSAGRSLREFLSQERPDLKFAFFVDSKATGTIEGMVIIGPAQLASRSQDYDVLLIASSFMFEIGDQLQSLGVSEYWICDYHLLDYAVYCTSSDCADQRQVSRERSFSVPGSHVREIYGRPINFLPSAEDLRSEDAIGRFVLGGYLPEEPFISKTTRVTAIGSCFAGHIRKHLVARGYRLTGDLVDSTQADEGYRYYDKAYLFYRHSDLETTFVAREQFEWALEDRHFSEQLWYDHHDPLNSRDKRAQEATRRLLLETDVLIFTLGLAELWQDIKTSEVIWGSIPDDLVNSDTHRFRLSTVAENVENLERIYALVRKHMPTTRIVITLSPVPLNGTWRDISCISANTVSKATLRVAIDEVWRRHRDEGFLYYWPAYEIVKETTPNPFKRDNRHIRDEVVAEMMELFSSSFLTDGTERIEKRVSRRPMLPASPSAPA